VLVEVVLPSVPQHYGWAVEEIARRHGDYALVGAAASVVLDDDGRCEKARLVLFSVGDGPVQAYTSAGMLIGERPTDTLIVESADAAASEDIDPPGDIHATAEYRRHLTRVLSRRVLGKAFARAEGRL
jgi:aerobic carbon-monoxide dehydrogenase medium subunit